MQDIITTDLSFGDQGKGKTVDFLTREYGADLVVRYTGADQAAHNVVLPDGRHHTFSQIGSGTFAGAKTYLSPYMFTNPLSLVGEAEVLEKKGIEDPLSSVYVDPATAFVTPFHQYVNQLREISRGENRHGSCGRGVGESVRDVRNRVGIGPIYLFTSDLVRQLDFIWRYKIDQAEQLVTADSSQQAKDIFDKLRTPGYPEVLAEEYEKIYSQVKSGTFGIVPFDRTKPVIYEGSQGVLLDEKIGFAPHVTHFNTTAHNAKEIADERESIVIGLLRAYSTRHGQGPFVSECKNLSKLLPDKQNTHNEWQGEFRVGWFDMVATQYSLASCDQVDQLAITCVDRLSILPEVKIVTSYEYLGEEDAELAKYFDYEVFEGNRIRIRSIKPIKEGEKLTAMLLKCRPLDWEVFKSWQLPTKIKSRNDLPKELMIFLDYIQRMTNVPVKIVSYGETYRETIRLENA